MAKRMAAAATAGIVGIKNMPALNSGSMPTTRTTLVLPVTLDQNLELFAVKSGLPKGEIIKRVLADFLVKQGLQPDKQPKSINVSY